MTYEQLRVFQAIVTEGTFRGAAEKLNKSQPAVSVMIRNLEAVLGITLFSRDSYRPKLTAEGRAFFDRTVLALREMSRLGALAKRLAGQQEPRVEIAINAVCPLRPLLGTLGEIDVAYPATLLKVTTESMGGAIERLAEGSADIALTTETDIRPDQMEALPFATVRIIPVARPDYPPARSNAFNTADDMRAYVQVIVADSSAGAREQSLDILPEAKHWVVTDFAAKKDIIIAGMGWGGLPEHVVADELARGELVRVHVEGFEIRTSQLYIIRRTDRTVGVVAEALWQALRRLSARGGIRA